VISAGGYHSLAALSGGDLYAFGDQSDCQTGTRPNTLPWSPLALPGVRNATLLAAGDHHAIALEQDGTVYSWGNDSRGQLGLGPPRRRDVCDVTPLERSAVLATAGSVVTALLRAP
jgi:alpha-tubulin suppressor-like RCC1 family protein